MLNKLSSFKKNEKNPKITPANMSDIEDILELVSIINEQPARFLPLADGISCPFCKSIIHDEINIPEESVRMMKCQKCYGIFYFDYRDTYNVKFDQVFD